MLLLKLLPVFSLLLVVCNGQTTTAAQSAASTLPQCSPPANIAVPDVFSLDDWEKNPNSFGQTVLGVLSSNPYERYTVQRLMNMIKDGMAGGGGGFEFLPQLLRGYFALLPDLLSDPNSQGISYLYANDTENQLYEHAKDSFFNSATRNETSYYDLDEKNLDRPKWLMSKFNWQQVFLVKRTYLLILQYLINIPYEQYQPDGVNDQCYTDVVHTIRSLYIGKQWAIEMLDSTGKPPIGLFQGNLNWVGQYDQCYKIVADRSNISTQKTIQENVFQGSYCDISMDTDKALPGVDIPKAPGQKLFLKIGLCMPSTCSSGDVHKIMQNIKIAGNQFPEIEKTRCHNESPMSSGEFSTDVLAHVASGILGTFVILTVLATLIEGCFWFEYDYGLEEKKQGQKSLDATKTEANGNANGGFHHHPSDKISKEMVINGDGGNIYQNGATPINQSQSIAADTPKSSPPKDSFFKQLVKTFSLYTNVPALMSTKQSKSAIKSLDALRVFNMNWIILGHVYSIGAVFIPETMSNAKLAVEKIKDPTYMGVFNGMLAVDSFFFISGLLVSYLFLKTSKKSNPAGIWIKQMVLYYVHRFIRILPLYGVLILVYAAFGKYLGSGPLFNWQSDRVRDCNTNWWANLLFINNFVNPREMCLGWSWYLSNDMQFYIVAPLMLIPLFLMPAIGMFIIAVVMFVHWGVTAWLWSLTEGKSYLQDPDIFYEAYLTPYCRIGPYLVGLVLGFIFYKKYQLKNKLMILAGWLLCVFTMGVVIYVQYEDTRIHGVSKPTWKTVQRTAYETLSRDAWAMALAWIVYACNIGYGGFIAHIINWRGWAPLSKMTFAVYLIHPLVIFIYVGNRRDLHHVDDFSVAFMYCGYTLLSYVAGAILSLIFEVPPAALDKLFLGKARRPKSKGKASDNEASPEVAASTRL